MLLLMLLLLNIRSTPGDDGSRKDPVQERRGKCKPPKRTVRVVVYTYGSGLCIVRVCSLFRWAL